ncbi:hypothetical protein BGZ96_004370, partial [Linnemannia gamsii]
MAPSDDSFSVTFTPHLWHSITINRKDAIPKFQSPEGRAGLLRNGHLIQVLRADDPIVLEPFVEFGTTCTNLVSLDVTHSLYDFTGNVAVIRSSEMLSKGRRKGSIGAGQKSRLAISSFTSTAFGSLSGSNGSDLFGASTMTGLFSTPVAASTGLSNASASTELSDTPTSTSFGLVEAPTSTGFGFSGISASMTAGSTSLSTKVPSLEEFQRDGETYLVSVLERNPQLEFLVIPSHCLDCEGIVRVAGETLLSLKEFYSDDDLWQRGPSTFFKMYEHATRTGTSRIIAASEAVVEGSLKSTEGELLHPLLNSYPRLRELPMGISAKVNHDALERIRLADREITYLEMNQGPPSHVAQILTLAPPLKHLVLAGVGGRYTVHAYNDNRVKAAFLRHAPTLEHLDTAT